MLTMIFRPLLLESEIKAFHKAKELSKNEEIYSLSRDNITSNAMKIEIEDTKLEQGLLDHLIDADTNSHRCNAVA
jgi:DNA helicase-2/ATP-dependent DNA helicase PcrA